MVNEGRWTVDDITNVLSVRYDQMVIVAICVCEADFHGYATYEASYGTILPTYPPSQAQQLDSGSHLYFRMKEDEQDLFERAERTKFGGKEKCRKM